jgi:hypothetical protein
MGKILKRSNPGERLEIPGVTYSEIHGSKVEAGHVERVTGDSRLDRTAVAEQLVTEHPHLWTSTSYFTLVATVNPLEEDSRPGTPADSSNFLPLQYLSS